MMEKYIGNQKFERTNVQPKLLNVH